MDTQKTEFATLQEALSDRKCKEFIDIRLTAIRKARWNKGPLKADAFQVISQRGDMRYEYLVDQFEKIDSKQSTLPARERNLIHAIVEEALIKTLEYYQERLAKI